MGFVSLNPTDKETGAAFTHLNPTSPFFPHHYRDIVDAIRAAERDKSQRQSVHYADPYAQLEELNETFKKIRYKLQHTDDAAEISKLANSQVRVAGAMFVLNERLQSKHDRAIQDAKTRAQPLCPLHFFCKVVTSTPRPHATPNKYHF